MSRGSTYVFTLRVLNKGTSQIIARASLSLVGRRLLRRSTVGGKSQPCLKGGRKVAFKRLAMHEAVG